MGLFLPLVIYTAARKRYGDWPTNPYNLKKVEFLEKARNQLASFAEHVNHRLPDVVTFGVREYRDDLNIFETDIAKKPRLSSGLISNNCTLLLADPRDLIRNKREIENDNKDVSEDQIERIVLSEISAVSQFLTTFTQILFVPGFDYPPYRDPFSKDLTNYAENYTGFLDDNMGLDKEDKLMYANYDDELLNQVAMDLMVLQEKSRNHIATKLKGLQGGR